MENVEFSEEKAYNATLDKAVERATSNEKSLSTLPIRLGLAKDETGATIILVGIGVLAFILAAIIFVVALG